MAGWRTRNASPRAVVALALLAVLLVAAIPGALLVGLILMLLGHIIAGLAFAGGSIVVAVAAVALAGLSGKRYVRRLAESMGFRVLRLKDEDYNYVRPDEYTTHDDDYTPRSIV
jgi:multisubunit Na+/H+ antiporter MnhB subunit